jgi:hypothetical protein
VTVSCGVATYPANAANATELVAGADAAGRHLHVVTAPLDGGRLAVVCAEPARAVLDAIAALAAQGGLALGHARLLTGRRGGDAGESRGLRSAGA